MEIVYDDEEHRYWINGQEALSVTQLLKLNGIAPDLGTFYTEESRKRGTAVHLAAELISKEVQDLEDYEDSPYYLWIKGFSQFREEYNLKPLAIEKMVGNAAWLVAGRFDLAGVVKGVETLIDLKTGSKMRHHGVQLAGYNLLDGGTRTRPRAVLQLFSKPSKGRHYSMTYYNDPSDYDCFAGAAAMTAWKRVNA